MATEKRKCQRKSEKKRFLRDVFQRNGNSAMGILILDIIKRVFIARANTKLFAMLVHLSEKWGGREKISPSCNQSATT